MEIYRPKSASRVYFDRPNWIVHDTRQALKQTNREYHLAALFHHHHHSKIPIHSAYINTHPHASLSVTFLILHSIALSLSLSLSLCSSSKPQHPRVSFFPLANRAPFSSILSFSEVSQSCTERTMGLSTNFEDSTDRRLLKQVHDNVHGNIYLEPV